MSSSYAHLPSLGGVYRDAELRRLVAVYACDEVVEAQTHQALRSQCVGPNNA